MDTEIAGLENRLEEAMGSLIQIMRCVLTNIQEERQALLLGNAPLAAILLFRRNGLLDEMNNGQREMTICLEKMNIPPCELEDLAETIGSDKVTILSLKDQILALTEAIEKQNSQTGVCLGQQTAPQPKPKRCALTVIEKP